jgi:hypothetical protein
MSVSLWCLFLSTPLFATYEQEGKEFGQQLHSKGYDSSGAQVQNMKQQFSQQPSNRGFESHNAELSATFESSYDTGKKGEDPLKNYFAQKNVQAAKSKLPHQPSLTDAENLLKQKHRFKISTDDPVFKKHQEISNAPIEDKEGIFLKGQPPFPQSSELKDKLVKCRVGSAGQEKICVKTRVINLASPNVSTITASISARAHRRINYTINFASNSISMADLYPTNTNYYSNNYTIMNKDGIIGYSAIVQPISNRTNYDQVNYVGVISKSNGNVVVNVLQHPHPSNGYVALLQLDLLGAPSYEYMQVLNAKLQWQVVGPANLAADTWKGCEDLERHTQEGFCEMVGSEPQGLNETRHIAGYPYPITREYWSENKTFLCGGGREFDECEPWVQQKCEQLDSQCVETKNGLCIEYENTFRCGVPDYLKGDGLEFKSGKVSFLTGQGQPSLGYEAGDFGEAVTHFSALTEMGKKLQDELDGILGDPANPSVFHGKCSQCRVNIGSFFRDCCKLKGVLQGLLGQCNEEEKKLAVAAIRNKRCVKVEGRYCHKKNLGICVEKRDSYCCYGSQLARIIQEIAHHQLNIPWGTAEHPNCSSLTAEQLSRLDFDTPYAQQKLAEIMAEVQATAQEKFQLVQNAVAQMGDMQEKISSLSDKHHEALTKNSMVSDKLKVRAEEQRKRALIEEYETLKGKSYPEHHEAWMNDISQIEKELHGGKEERQRKLKKITEYQAFEKQLNALEDRLGIEQKSWGIPKEGTPEPELLHWFDTVVGEPGVDAHIEGIYKPRLKTYQKLEITTPSEYADIFIQTFGDKFDRNLANTRYQNANGQRRKLLIESLDLSSPHRAFLNAAATGDLVAAQKALGSGAHVKAIQENGYTALQLAIVFNRDITLIDYLIKQGSDLHYQDNDLNKTALALAESLQRQDVVELIRRSL